MDAFKYSIMEQALLDFRVNLTSESAEAFSASIINMLDSTYNKKLAKKLFYKIAKGNFIRGSATTEFMNIMLSRSW